MDVKFKRISQDLIELDKKAEELDKVLQNVRVAINNVLWDLMESRKNKPNSSDLKKIE